MVNKKNISQPHMRSCRKAFHTIVSTTPVINTHCLNLLRCLPSAHEKAENAWLSFLKEQNQLKPEDKTTLLSTNVNNGNLVFASSTSKAFKDGSDNICILQSLNDVNYCAPLDLSIKKENCSQEHSISATWSDLETSSKQKGNECRSRSPPDFGSLDVTVSSDASKVWGFYSDSDDASYDIKPSPSTQKSMRKSLPVSIPAEKEAYSCSDEEEDASFAANLPSFKLSLCKPSLSSLKNCKTEALVVENKQQQNNHQEEVEHPRTLYGNDSVIPKSTCDSSDFISYSPVPNEKLDTKDSITRAEPAHNCKNSSKYMHNHHTKRTRSKSTLLHDKPEPAARLCAYTTKGKTIPWLNCNYRLHKDSTSLWIKKPSWIKGLKKSQFISKELRGRYYGIMEKREVTLTSKSMESNSFGNGILSARKYVQDSTTPKVGASQFLDTHFCQKQTKKAAKFTSEPKTCSWRSKRSPRTASLHQYQNMKKTKESVEKNEGHGQKYCVVHVDHALASTYERKSKINAMEAIHQQMILDANSTLSCSILELPIKTEHQKDFTKDYASRENIKYEKEESFSRDTSTLSGASSDESVVEDSKFTSIKERPRRVGKKPHTVTHFDENSLDLNSHSNSSVSVDLENLGSSIKLDMNKVENTVMDSDISIDCKTLILKPTEGVCNGKIYRFHPIFDDGEEHLQNLVFENRGLLILDDVIIPYVVENGFKYTQICDMVKLFTKCATGCPIVKRFLMQKQGVLAALTFELVDLLDRVKVGKKKPITGDPIIRAKYVLDNFEQLEKEVSILHKNTKCKRSLPCQY